MTSKQSLVDIKVKELFWNEAEELFKPLRKKYPNTQTIVRFFSQDAFGEELTTISPTAVYTYYLVEVNNNHEAVIKMNYSTNTYNIAAFGRFKEQGHGKGWQYLRALLDQVLLQKCKKNKFINIQCLCRSEGSKNAFSELNRKGHLPDEWKLELSDNNGSIYANLWLKTNLK